MNLLLIIVSLFISFVKFERVRNESELKKLESLGIDITTFLELMHLYGAAQTKTNVFQLPINNGITKIYWIMMRARAPNK